MKLTVSRLGLAIASAGLVTIYGCGGGGGGAVSTSSGPTITGVAATGSAMGNASVTLTDATGTVTSCGATNTATGAYSCTLPANATAPFVIRALNTETGDALYSVLAQRTASVVNVTPLTNAIAAALSPTGDPAALADQIKTSTAQVTATTISAQVSQLQTSLAEVISAAGNPTFDPIAGNFTAGSSTGMDKVLDIVKVSIAPQSSTGAGTQPGAVTLSLRADPDTTVTLTNGSNSAPPPIPQNAVTAVAAVTSLNPTALISELFTKMNTCYALTVTDRVSSTAPSAVAADVKAPCQNFFYTADASTFKSGGNVVGPKGAFKSLYSSAATGVTFDKGNLEFVVNNPGQPNDGVWVVSYRSTLPDGTANFDTFALKLDNGNLRQYGNQYDYDTNVQAFVQDREFVNQLASNYLSTGYVLNVSNQVDINGNSVFNKVVVTSPGNRTFTLKPKAGISYLGLVNAASTTLSTNFVRIGYAPTDANATSWSSEADAPGTEEARLFFAPTKWNDADIANIPDQGTWQFDIWLAGNNTGTPNVTQKSRTLGRAPTIGEVRTLKFATLTSTQRSEVTTMTSGTGWYTMNGTGIALITDANNNDAWTVPTGALAPTKATVFGNAPLLSPGNWGNSFNDFVSLLPSARKTSIPCGRQSNADLHCVNTVAVGATGNYANGTRITELQLNTGTPRGSVSKHVAFYTP